MANIKVIIIDANRLRLDQDAKKGDIIDLRDVNEVDTSVLLDQIEKAQDKVYIERLKVLEADIRKEYELKKTQEVSKVKMDVQRLEQALNTQEEVIKSQYKLTMADNSTHYEKKLAALNNELITSKVALENAHARTIQELNNKIANIAIVKDNEYMQKMNVLEAEKVRLQNNLELTNSTNKQATELEILKLKEAHKEQLDVKDKLINDLERSRINLNIKNTGENLELWCDNEYESQSLAGLNNVLWLKDNESIKLAGEKTGSKADFIYKVYATEEKLESQLLTSAILEMKSELLESSNKRKNSDHYKKLDNDRNKKGLEYAILVSELEWDRNSTNDVPIRKVSEYEKMYVVRPQYFMTLLNIITSLGMKYREILLDKEQQRLSFKEEQDLLDEFETMKSDIIDNSIRHIQTNMNNLIKESTNIQIANEKLLKYAEIVLNTHLETVINKINDFKINRITNKLKDIE